ncbi:hypothetical protein SynBOUM118_00408 [Synechococcus sp. BOUM118]|nr:hypothetical protein SynBOUM118_00408 [Synechococcus sp. BOUM118]
MISARNNIQSLIPRSILIWLSPMEILIAVLVLVACIIMFNGWESISHLDA